jgi:hypothetical protein
MENGLLGPIRRRLSTSKQEEEEVKVEPQGNESKSFISPALLLQGLHYYFALESSRLVFLVVYFSVDGDSSYKVMVTAFLVTIGPLMSARLFRKTSDLIRNTNAKGSQVQQSSQQRTDPEILPFTYSGTSTTLLGATKHKDANIKSDTSDGRASNKFVDDEVDKKRPRHALYRSYKRRSNFDSYSLRHLPASPAVSATRHSLSSEQGTSRGGHSSNNHDDITPSQSYFYF